MKKMTRITESDLVKIITKVLKEYEGEDFYDDSYENTSDFDIESAEISGGGSATINNNEIIVRSNNLKTFFNDVRKKTKNKRIDLNSIQVSLNDKGESFFKCKISEKSKPVTILIPYNEEVDKGFCPSCMSIREKNPGHRLIKVGKFGKTRVFQVIAIKGIDIKEKTKTKRKPFTPATACGSKAIKFIAEPLIEGFRSYIYDDKCPNSGKPNVKEPNSGCGGTLTIGYGTSVKYYPELKDYLRGSKYKFTKKQAMDYVIKHIKNETSPEIRREIKIDMNQTQYDMLCSFVYNIGHVPYDLRNAINTKNYKEIKKAWSKYVYQDDEKKPGLVNRRKKEMDAWILQAKLLDSYE